MSQAMTISQLTIRSINDKVVYLFYLFNIADHLTKVNILSRNMGVVDEV